MSLESIKAEYAKVRDLKNAYQRCIDDLQNWINSAQNTIQILGTLQQESITAADQLRQQIEQYTSEPSRGALEESA